MFDRGCHSFYLRHVHEFKKVGLDTTRISVGSRERAMDRSTLLNIPFVGEEVVVERQHFLVVEDDYQVVP